MLFDRSTHKTFHYDIHEYSTHATQYPPSNIKTNDPTDPTSRWSTSTSDHLQFITLKIEPSIVTSITFGKFSKIHVCNIKEMRIRVSRDNRNWVDVFYGGLRNDTEMETFCANTQIKIDGWFRSTTLQGNELSSHEFNEENTNSVYRGNTTHTCNGNPTHCEDTSYDQINQIMSQQAKSMNEKTAFNKPFVGKPLEKHNNMLSLSAFPTNKVSDFRTIKEEIANKNILLNLKDGFAPYKYLITEYVRIEPLASWGLNFNYSVWFVEIHGVSSAKYLQFNSFVDYIDKTRLCLRFMLQNGFYAEYESVSKATGIKLHNVTRISVEDIKIAKNIILKENSDQELDYYDYLEAKILSLDDSYFSDYIIDAPYTGKWQRISETNPWPCERGGHQMVVMRNSIYMYGGWNGQEELGDLWVYKDGWNLIYDIRNDEMGTSRENIRTCEDEQSSAKILLNRRGNCAAQNSREVDSSRHIARYDDTMEANSGCRNMSHIYEVRMNRAGQNLAEHQRSNNLGAARFCTTDDSFNQSISIPVSVTVRENVSCSRPGTMQSQGIENSNYRSLCNLCHSDSECSCRERVNRVGDDLTDASVRNAIGCVQLPGIINTVESQHAIPSPIELIESTNPISQNNIAKGAVGLDRQQNSSKLNLLKPGTRSCHRMTTDGETIYLHGKYLSSPFRDPTFEGSRIFCFSDHWYVLNMDIYGGPGNLFDHQICYLENQLVIFGGRSTEKENVYGGLWVYSINADVTNPAVSSGRSNTAASVNNMHSSVDSEKRSNDAALGNTSQRVHSDPATTVMGDANETAAITSSPDMNVSTLQNLSISSTTDRPQSLAYATDQDTSSNATDHDTSSNSSVFVSNDTLSRVLTSLILNINARACQVSAALIESAINDSSTNNPVYPCVLEILNHRETGSRMYFRNMAELLQTNQMSEEEVVRNLVVGFRNISVELCRLIGRTAEVHVSYYSGFWYLVDMLCEYIKQKDNIPEHSTGNNRQRRNPIHYSSVLSPGEAGNAPNEAVMDDVGTSNRFSENENIQDYRTIPTRREESMPRNGSASNGVGLRNAAVQGSLESIDFPVIVRNVIEPQGTVVRSETQSIPESSRSFIITEIDNVHFIGNTMYSRSGEDGGTNFYSSERNDIPIRTSYLHDSEAVTSRNSNVDNNLNIRGNRNNLQQSGNQSDQAHTFHEDNESTPTVLFSPNLIPEERVNLTNDILRVLEARMRVGEPIANISGPFVDASYEVTSDAQVRLDNNISDNTAAWVGSMSENNATVDTNRLTTPQHSATVNVSRTIASNSRVATNNDENSACLNHRATSRAQASRHISKHWRLIRNDEMQPQCTPALRSRLGHSMLFIPRSSKSMHAGCLALLGGHKGKDFIREIEFYNLDTDTIYSVIPFPIRAEKVVQRSVLHGEEIVSLMCWSNDKDEKCDNIAVYVYSLIRNQWSQVNFESRYDALDSSACDVIGDSRRAPVESDTNNANSSDILYNEAHNSPLNDPTPSPRTAHQFVNLNGVFYLFGGNPTGASDKRSSEFWKLSLKKPTPGEVKGICQFVVRKHKFLALLDSDKEVAIKYLQDKISVLVNETVRKMFEELCYELYWRKISLSLEEELSRYINEM